MKKYYILILMLLSFGALSFADAVSDTVAMGNNYESDVYYSLKNGTVKTVSRDNWDIGFYTNRWSAGILINDGIGVELFTYPHGDTAAWNAVDTLGFANWIPMYNSDTIWEDGAFSRNALGHPDYGWGIYNMITHNVVGDSLFVVKLANGSFKKLWIELKNSTLNSFSFKYANLDGSDEVVEEIDVTPYQDNRLFIYYNMRSQSLIDREPDINEWDLLWSRYASIVFDNEGNPSYYIVVGVLNNLDVGTVKYHPVEADFTDWFNQEFEYHKTSIGHDWKEFSMSEFAWTIQDSTTYFVKDRVGDVYKLDFDYFSGTASGETGLRKQLISYADLTEIRKEQRAVIYPNPGKGQIHIGLENPEDLKAIHIFDMSGRQVMVKEFYNSNSLSFSATSLTDGVYIIEIVLKNTIERQKLIIR